MTGRLQDLGLLTFLSDGSYQLQRIGRLKMEKR